MRSERLYITTEQPILIISDLHIGYRPSYIDKALDLIDQFNLVILNGDIYDLWLADQKFLMRSRESRTLWSALEGKNSIYIRGNHDWEYEGDSYESVTINYGDRYSAMVVHGHQFDPRHASAKPGLTSYMFARFDAYVSGLFKFSLQGLLQRFHDLPLISTKVQRVLGTIRNNALTYLDATNVDWIVHGHTHFPWLYRHADNRGIVDGGSFVTGATCVILDRNGPRLVDLQDNR